MKIIRIKNPEISIWLLPWYVEDDKTVLEIGMELNDRMQNEPDNTCVLLAVDKGYLKAVLVGYLDGNKLIIWQGKKSKDMNRMHLLGHKLYKWAREHGATKAVLGSSDKRVRRLYKRKYGYHSIGGPLMEKSL